MEATQNLGADDVVVSVPVATLMEEGDTVMKPDGMMVLFAGVPNGTMGKVNLSNVYLSNAQYTGTSASQLRSGFCNGRRSRGHLPVVR
jgi:hypothetical protein